MRSYNDDLVMALAIGCWVRDTALTVNQKDMEYNKAMMSSMIISNKNMNTTIPGMIGHKVNNAEKLKEQQKQYQDFIWLIKG